MQSVSTEAREESTSKTRELIARVVAGEISRLLSLGSKGQTLIGGIPLRELEESANKEGKYLTFGLGGEEYGLEILKVKEIIGIMNITFIPHTPIYVKGVINLRGKVIPVIDLRLKFGMDSLEYTELC